MVLVVRIWGSRAFAGRRAPRGPGPAGVTKVEGPEEPGYDKCRFTGAEGDRDPSMGCFGRPGLLKVVFGTCFTTCMARN